MNVKDTLSKLASINDVAELNALQKDEQRKTVLDAIANRILELTQGEEAGDEEDPDTDVEGGDTDGAEGDEDETPAPAAAPPVVKGKGGTATAPRKPVLQVLHPKASGKLGFEGRLYSRAQVARDPDLMERMHAAGCKAIKKM